MNLPIEQQEKVLSNLVGADKLVIKSDNDFEEISGYLKKIKRIGKEWLELRKSFTDPLNDSKNKIMDFFRPAETQLKDEEKAVKVKMCVWIEHKEKLAREEVLENERKRQEVIKEAEKADEDFDFDKKSEKIIEANSIEAVKTTMEDGKAKAQGISTSKKWCYEITDFEKVPIEYKLIDKVALNKVITALKDKSNIPGVRVYAETVVRSR